MSCLYRALTAGTNLCRSSREEKDFSGAFNSVNDAPMPSSTDLKKSGFLPQRQPEYFSIRLRIPVGNITSDQLSKISEVAREYGRGFVHLTTRQGLEIPFVSQDQIFAVSRELEKVGLGPGSCGPRVRNVVSCPGSRWCSHGLVDSMGMGEEIDKRFFSRILPRKIKIAVSGCPNSCAKPQQNDIGLMGTAEPALDKSLCNGCRFCYTTCREDAITLDRDNAPVIDEAKCVNCGECISVCPTRALTAVRAGWTIFLGGKVGRHPRLGDRVAEFLTDEEALRLVERVLEGFERIALPDERFGSTIDRVGRERIEDMMIRE